MATKKDEKKRKFNRKHLFWIVPLALVLALVAYATISVWRDYEDDRENFSLVVESNQVLSDTVYSLTANRADIVVTGMRDYCTYDQGKLGREGPPECGREIVLQATDPNTREDISRTLVDKVGELSMTDSLINRVPYERHCGIHDNLPMEGGLAARCSQNMKVWDMYPDFPDRTYN